MFYEKPLSYPAIQDVCFPALCVALPADGISHPLQGEIFWLISCQRFITSKELLSLLLWSHNKCQCLIWTKKIFECFCSSPPCVQVQQKHTGFSIRSLCQDNANSVFALFWWCGVDLLSTSTVYLIWDNRQTTKTMTAEPWKYLEGFIIAKKYYNNTKILSLS